MIVNTYGEWATYHIKAFGMKFQGDDEMVECWVEAFIAAGFTAAELHEASVWMLTESAPKRREDHLDMIQKRITYKRTEGYRAAILMSQRKEHESRCASCDNAGLVIVPHPAFYVDGLWSTPWPTAAVSCSCVIGQKAKSDAEKREAPMMALNVYRELHPDWKEQMEQHKKTQLAFVNARSHTRFVDSQLGQLMGSILKKVKMHEQTKPAKAV